MTALAERREIAQLVEAQLRCREHDDIHAIVHQIGFLQGVDIGPGHAMARETCGGHIRQPAGFGRDPDDMNERG